MTETADFGVVAIGASAGGQSAILALLRNLPLDFDVPIVVVQHLPVESTLRDIYAARLPYTFEWVTEQSTLAPRKVLLCPPRSCTELLPDGSFRLHACEGGALDRQIDRVLHSVALSFSHRAIAVVLTGMGRDGALGARELHVAGGRVLVQMAASAEYTDMPKAAIAAGAADLVVPLDDMAQVLTELVSGAVRPKARSELEAIEQVFGIKGEVAALARDIDWSRTPIGTALEWPIELRLLARTAIESPHPTAIWWGRSLVQIYNDAYRRFLGVRQHPEALGRPACETWNDAWGRLAPIVDQVLARATAVDAKEVRLVIDRHGVDEEAFVSFAYSPIRDVRGVVVGIHSAGWETTRTVVAERRMAALRALAAHIIGADTPRQACERAASVLDAAPFDLPFALLYLFDPGRRNATLAGTVGLPAGSAAAPHTMGMVAARDLWALQRLLQTASAADSPGLLLEDIDRRAPEIAALLSHLEDRLIPRAALVLPLRWAEDKPPIGALIAGLSPQRPLDEDYRNFLRLVTQQISAGLAEARARELERERSERLAELDRAKIEFFANVSHEFRTPLTLLLSPLEEIRRRRDELPVGLATEIDVVARNSHRLLRLVDSLLDFAQGEERRQRVVLQLTDLAALTTDVASVFRSAIERAGLTLRVECQPGLPLVPVDRILWEKVLSNLLSNALKFTFEGGIVVRLRAMSLHVELVVSDSGVGIPKHELPHLFKRFHRVRGTRARTIEGSGIGLAIVHDLVTRMRGQVQVQSSEGSGTSFTIWMPLKAHRQASDIPTPLAPGDVTSHIAAGLAEEANAWFGSGTNAGLLDDPLASPKNEQLRLAPGARVLVADDNADLRQYLQRLLGAYWKVTVVADGAEALAEARRAPPDLILADVMMPVLDGFALLRAIRDDATLKHTPFIFLTARAAEDRAIEGLVAGADDYLAKPFSARELIARVGGQIVLSHARRRTEEINAFLVRFSDAVRGLVDAREIGQTACRMLHEHLGVERAYWAEVDEATREYVVTGGVHSPHVTPIEGRFPLDAWESFASPERERWSHIVEDTQTDSRISDVMKSGYASIEIGADLTSPVVVDGALRCVLAVNQRSPRRWTAEEVALVEGVAGRCWAEVERVHAEAALRASEARLLAVLQQAPLAIAFTGLSGEILFRNAMFDTLWGQPAHPAAARTHGDVYAGFHLDGRPVASGEWPGARAVLNGEVVKDEVYELVQRDGRRVACGFAAGPIRDQNGQITGGVVLFRDVSEERRIQEALRHSEEKYRGLFEEMDEAYAVVEMISDASGRWTDFRFLEVNRPFMRHTGMPYPVGRTATDLLRNPNPRWAELYGRAADTGESVRLEEGEVTLGRVFDLNIFRLRGPGSRRIAVLFTDITERKRAELALQKGEQRRLVALDMAGIGDWAYDVASGELHCSARARAMHGVGPETRVDIELHDRLIHPDDRAAVQAARASALDPAGTGEYFMEFRFLPVDGTERLMQSMGRVIYEDTPDGRRAVQIIGAMIDVTHRLSVARHRGII